MDKYRLKEIVQRTCLEAGLEKKRTNTWYKVGTECITLLNLQKSSFSDLFYLNIASFIRSLDPELQNPPEKKCHFRLRLPDPMIGSFKATEYFDLEVPIEDDQRETGLIQVLCEVAVPQMTKISTKQGIIQICHEKPPLKNILKSEARRELGL